MKTISALVNPYGNVNQFDSELSIVSEATKFIAEHEIGHLTYTHHGIIIDFDNIEDRNLFLLFFPNFKIV